MVLRPHIAALDASGPLYQQSQRRPLTESAYEALRRARIEAAIRRHRQIRTGHVLLAALGNPEASDLLASVGAPPDLVRYAVIPRLDVEER